MEQKRPTAAFEPAFEPALRHDHGRCIADALRTADEVCEARGVRLTPLRRLVLELVWSSHAPVRAYDILDHLRDERSNAAPPTVYRALDFLLQQGLVHRIESLNAYVGCALSDRGHGAQFLICRVCGRVAELDDGAIVHDVEDAAARLGFRVEHQTVEVTGLCPACADKLVASGESAGEGRDDG